MKILLDTHAFLWWGTRSPRLGAKAAEVISDPANRIFVSAATLWEVATKVRLGKLQVLDTADRSLVDRVSRLGFESLPVMPAHAELAGSIVHDHRDPFDRMLIAQSLSEHCAIVSNEVLFDQFGVNRIW